MQPLPRNQSQFRLLVPRTMARVGSARQHTAAFWPVLFLDLLAWIVLLAGMSLVIVCSEVRLGNLGWSATSTVLVTLPRYTPGRGFGPAKAVREPLYTVSRYVS